MYHVTATVVVLSVRLSTSSVGLISTPRLKHYKENMSIWILSGSMRCRLSMAILNFNGRKLLQHPGLTHVQILQQLLLAPTRFSYMVGRRKVYVRATPTFTIQSIKVLDSFSIASSDSRAKPTRVNRLERVRWSALSKTIITSSTSSLIIKRMLNSPKIKLAHKALSIDWLKKFYSESQSRNFLILHHFLF